MCYIYTPKKKKEEKHTHAHAYENNGKLDNIGKLQNTAVDKSA